VGCLPDLNQGTYSFFEQNSCADFYFFADRFKATHRIMTEDKLHRPLPRNIHSAAVYSLVHNHLPLISTHLIPHRLPRYRKGCPLYRLPSPVWPTAIWQAQAASGHHRRLFSRRAVLLLHRGRRRLCSREAAVKACIHLRLPHTRHNRYDSVHDYYFFLVENFTVFTVLPSH
jgi:hypothetical protein